MEDFINERLESLISTPVPRSPLSFSWCGKSMSSDSLYPGSD